jgi:hypothetical protein
MAQTKDNKLEVIVERLIGEMRHRVVKRRRDMTYWYVSEYRDGEGKWRPMKVNNQSGRESDARLRYRLALNP